METRKNFNTPKVPRANTIFPQAVIADKFIFLSGTTGVDPSTGKLISDNFEEQASQALRSVPQVMPFPGGILISIECVALL